VSQQQPTGGFPAGSPSDNKIQRDKVRGMGKRRQSSRRHRLGAKVFAGAGALLLAVLAPAGTAFASTTSTSAATLTAGSLSVVALSSEAISIPVGGVTTGVLPMAQWTDDTGSGDGWSGTVALSDFTYTGSWKQTAGTATALAAVSSGRRPGPVPGTVITITAPNGGTFDGTADGVEYTVKVGADATSSSTPFTWTSDDPTDKAGGSGTATNGVPADVGTKGITIDFVSGTTYPEGATYQVDAGTLSPDAVTLSPSYGSVTAGTSTTSADPTLVGLADTVAGGGTSVSDYGTAVKFVSAAVDTGMGTYVIEPGVQIVADPSSWAATYTAGVQYSIVSGP